MIDEIRVYVIDIFLMGVRLSGHVLMLDVLCIVELSVQVIVDADRAAT